MSGERGQPQRTKPRESIDLGIFESLFESIWFAFWGFDNTEVLRGPLIYTTCYVSDVDGMSYVIFRLGYLWVHISAAGYCVAVDLHVPCFDINMLNTEDFQHRKVIPFHSPHVYETCPTYDEAITVMWHLSSELK